MNFFHKLLNPHCEECKKEDEQNLAIETEARKCNSCITLRQEIEYARYQNQQLLNTIIEMNQPKKEIIYEKTEAPIPIPNTRFQSFHEKRKQLEEQSRVEASRLNQLKKDNTASSAEVTGIEELEETIGIK